MKRYLRGYVQRDEDTAEDSGDKPLRIVAATEGLKGDGLNLKMSGVDLARFLHNPVVGYGHSYWGRDGLPIGRSEKTWVDGEKLMMDVVFDKDDPFAVTVDRKYRGGYLNAFSIGFDVLDFDQKSGDVEGWELFEVSSVPLPMDADAVVDDGRDQALALARDLRGPAMTPQQFADGVFAAMAALTGTDEAAARERLDKAARRARVAGI